MNIMDCHQEYEIEMKIKLSKLKIRLTADMEGERAFSGHALVMGADIPVSGIVNCTGHYSFPVSAHLPLGSFDVHIEADVDTCGQVTGCAVINGKKYIPLTGQRTR